MCKKTTLVFQEEFNTCFQHKHNRLFTLHFDIKYDKYRSDIIIRLFNK